MKTLIALVAIGLFSSCCLASDCVGNTCRQPLKSTVSKVASVTRTLVTAPVKVTRNITENVRARRFSRQYR